jgi:hypothetical protein
MSVLRLARVSRNIDPSVVVVLLVKFSKPTAPPLLLWCGVLPPAHIQLYTHIVRLIRPVMNSQLQTVFDTGQCYDYILFLCRVSLRLLFEGYFVIHKNTWTAGPGR